MAPAGESSIEGQTIRTLLAAAASRARVSPDGGRGRTRHNGALDFEMQRAAGGWSRVAINASFWESAAFVMAGRLIFGADCVFIVCRTRTGGPSRARRSYFWGCSRD